MLPLAIVPGMRTVTVTLELFGQDDAGDYGVCIRRRGSNRRSA